MHLYGPLDTQTSPKYVVLSSAPRLVLLGRQDSAADYQPHSVVTRALYTLDGGTGCRWRVILQDVQLGKVPEEDAEHQGRGQCAAPARSLGSYHWERLSKREANVKCIVAGEGGGEGGI